MKKRLFNKTAAIAAAVSLILSFASCSSDTSSVSKSDIKLDTVVTITLYGTKDTKPIDDAFAEIDRLASLLDVNVEGSDIYRLSQNAGKEWTEVSEETAEVLKTAEYYYKLSDGYFDVTAAPIVDLWNVEGGGYFPTQDEIDAAKGLTNGSMLLLDGNKAYLEKEGMKVDLGGIAKGYIADKVKLLLINDGIKHAVINLGGNIVLVGGKTDNEDFTVGIQDPMQETGAVLKRMKANDESLVSSGIYERYFEYNGKKYHHIMDPFTGAPSESGLAGVTILSQKSMDGDALSTTCMLLGLDKGMALIESINDTEAVFVTTNGDVYYSSGIKDRVFD